MRTLDLFPTEREHCQNVERDRKSGAYWERCFCVMCAAYGKTFTPHQIGRSVAAAAHYYDSGWRSLLLPDVSIWTSPGEDHEVKHKNPTKSGYYGLEEYRWRALVNFQKESGRAVYYTIHRWDPALGTHSEVHREGDWFTVSIADLLEAIERKEADYSNWPSYVGGKTKQVFGWYWPERLWHPLAEHLQFGPPPTVAEAP
jgi:hypothetical protein